MATAPTKVRIRSYNVGFGDCFLLTFSYARARDRNVLIDFGSSEGSPFGPRGGMLEIAEKIADDCGNKLEMVVATHRHADHISGFAGKTGAVIRGLAPDVVLQPWTENPDLDPNARAPTAAVGGPGLRARALVSRLSEMQALAAAVLAELPRLEAAPEVPKAVTDQLRFLGETNIKNADAVRTLMSMGTPIYASFGTRLPIGRLLPGVKIDVLGPPTLEQSSAIAEARRKDADEFWHLGARRARAARARGASRRLFAGSVATGSPPQEARWIIPKIDTMHAQEMLAIVRSLDLVLNNTSLILLFAVGDELLVFPGDAQIENWSYALFEARTRRAIRNRLARASFYKVGHHGSLNATPKTLWNGFLRRNAADAPDRLWTMMSTLGDKHGEAEDETEVPREPLVDELGRLSDFRTTQSIRSRTKFWHDVEIPRP